jgi:dTMP kinase
MLLLLQITKNGFMRLFVIEGVDGSGKSTQIRLLSEYFNKSGSQSEFLHFPRMDAPYFGELIVRFLRGEFGSLNQVDPYLVALLYAGDRMDAAGMIRKWLADKKFVLLDRYTYSNIAYQCAKIAEEIPQKKLLNWILKLEFEHFGIPRPDLNIFLDVPFSFTEKKLRSGRSGADRSYLNGSNDIHEESLTFQEKVRDIYLKVAQSDDRLAIVDCRDKKGNMRPPGDISALILELMRQRKLI